MEPILIFTILSFLFITRAEERGHGLNNESPIAFAPETYAFFHPNTLQPSTNSPCGSSDCTSLHVAATVQSTPAHQSASTGGKGLGPGGIVGIPLGFIFACIVGVGVYYVVIKRQANLRRTNNIEQQAEV